MAEGGGTGITTMPVLQSLSQARAKWGEHAASTIWDASIVKVILGGASASKDLQELSVLIGERDEPNDTVTISDYGARSIQRSTRRRHVMPPEQIRTLPFGTGLVLLRSAPPIVADLRTWTRDRNVSRRSHYDAGMTAWALDVSAHRPLSGSSSRNARLVPLVATTRSGANLPKAPEPRSLTPKRRLIRKVGIDFDWSQTTELTRDRLDLGSTRLLKLLEL